jgi:putative ABC transport system permease protein
MLEGSIRLNASRPRWSKVLSDLWDSKSRTLLVVASIAVGVFAMGMIVSAYAIISEDIDVSFAAIHPANIEIWTDAFQEDFVRIIERVPGVSGAEGRRMMNIRGKRNDEGWIGLTFIAIPDFEEMNINQLTVIDGSGSPGLREMLVSENFMVKTGYQVGDEILVGLPDGSEHALKVVGLVNDQVTGRGDPSSNPGAYITSETLRSLGSVDYFNRLVVTVDDGEHIEAIDAIAAQVEDKVESNGRSAYRVETHVSNVHPFGTMILALLGVLGALGVLVTILSGTLIINTLNALLTQQMRQIGVMKLIGGRSFQILGMYMVLIFAYGMIALLIAVPSGMLAGYGFAEFIAYMMGAELQGFRAVPIAIFLQILVAFLIPLGAGFFPVRKGSKTNVRRAISNDRPGSQTSGLSWMNKISVWFRWVSRPILLSIRNTFRERGRLALTMFTLTIAGAVFIAVFNVRASMAVFMDQLTQHFMGDVTLTFSQPYPVSRLKQVILPIPGIAGLEGWGGIAGEIWDEDDNVLENLFVIAPPADTQLLNPDIVAGRWLKPGERESIVVSDTIYDTFPDLLPGDTLRVKVQGERMQDWTVIGVFRFISMLGDPIAYADFDFVADLLNTPNQAMSYRVIIDDHSLQAQREMSKLLDKYLTDRGFPVSGAEAGLTTREQASQGINVLVVFLLIMALLTAFVGSIGLTGTMGMNVLERTREIGVMRAIGAVDLEIIKSVVIEGVMIGLITWALAIVASFPISFLLLNIISVAMMGTSMDLSITAQGMIIWLAVVILLSFVASILPARNAARLTINEVLAYE